MNRILSSALLLAGMVSVASAQVNDASAEIPRNLGGGLRDLIALHKSRAPGEPELELRGRMSLKDLTTGRSKLASGLGRRMVVDRSNRVLTTVHLDGTRTMQEMRDSLAALGISVVGENPEYHQGVLSVYLPLGSAERLARTPGVFTAVLAQPPINRVGAVTTQGASIVHSDQLNKSGLTGQGITVGILSDSYNGATVAPTAYDDVISGDLPNVGVADGRPGLKFLSDGGDDLSGFVDEGRAMAQIVYDIAPGVSLCFASSALGSASMASNIRRLRRDSSCFADVIVDDTVYPDEPWFSDGQITQAINDVTTGTTLAGKKVVYVTAAGNDGGTAYASPLRFVDNAAARALTGLPIDLTTVPASLDTSGGFHNFNPDASGTPVIAQKVKIVGADPTNGLVFLVQWDDPFNIKNGVTTDLDFVVFDSKGKYYGASADDNVSFEQALEGGGLVDGTYYFTFTRKGTGTHLATQLRWVAFNNGETVIADYMDITQPSIVEHGGAKNAISVGAYTYDNGLVSGQFTPELEPYTSAGPVILAFDSAGTRLSPYQTLQKPDVAAPDCVSNTFFGFQNLDDVFFSFCGTSAAAPHVAGVAALLLQAAGGPGSLTNDQVRSKLQTNGLTRDLDPLFSQANLTSGGATVNVSALGDYYDGSEQSSNFFTVTFKSSTAGQTLNSLSIDLTPTPQSLVFNPTTRTGFPFTVGKVSSGLAVTSTAPTAKTKILNLTFSGFISGSSLNFGIQPDCSLCTLAQNLFFTSQADTADMLAGATVTATLSDGAKLTGVIANKMGIGYTPFDGFGVIDAVAASKAP